jgi:hypothetical protein
VALRSQEALKRAGSGGVPGRRGPKKATRRSPRVYRGPQKGPGAGVVGRPAALKRDSPPAASMPAALKRALWGGRRGAGLRKGRRAMAGGRVPRPREGQPARRRLLSWSPVAGPSGRGDGGGRRGRGARAWAAGRGGGPWAEGVLSRGGPERGEGQGGGRGRPTAEGAADPWQAASPSSPL